MAPSIEQILCAAVESRESYAYVKPYPPRAASALNAVIFQDREKQN